MEQTKSDIMRELSELGVEIMNDSVILNPNSDQAAYRERLWDKKRRLMAKLNHSNYQKYE